MPCWITGTAIGAGGSLSTLHMSSVTETPAATSTAATLQMDAEGLCLNCWMITMAAAFEVKLAAQSPRAHQSGQNDRSLLKIGDAFKLHAVWQKPAYKLAKPQEECRRGERLGPPNSLGRLPEALTGSAQQMTWGTLRFCST